MFLLRFILFFSVIVGFVMIVTQIIIPLWREQPLFPWFNKCFQKLDDEKRAVAEEQMKKKLKQLIEKSKKT